MPFYDFKCPEGCGYFNDIFVPLAQHGKTECSDCGALLTTVISEVALIGPMPSKPLVVKQIGKSFESERDWKKYQRENPDCAIVSADSKQWRDHKDLARAKVESRSKKMGYRDFEDRKTRRKKEKDKKSGKLDKNIFVY
tara:strand:- start:33 stop:449 length:417 start_codon:yes stop_codon:yes gene_type:complete